MRIRNLPKLLTALLMLSVLGCSSENDVPNETPDAGQVQGREEPKLAAECRETPEICPAGLQCVLELGCIVTSCPKAGPGAASGCPENGFCYTIDSNTQGYCTRLCETDADCTAVNPALICRERSSTEAFGKKICITPN
ncbi:hypothetical protein [Corallococcus aberystwythensis]|uniref:Lipoprotein n=1 Tax=Corallococcus aberystwythensis TaxID=2316722 RepID=A0A3A8QHQ5_9BACT|nr:hypothetical protein [Corallococcus aberystwythensis]RKH68117.1 hypothetical protein D7W81_12920 [Corallococcus aberystwythensis]